MEERIRKLHEDAVIPSYASNLAAGFDLVATEDVFIAPGDTAVVKGHFHQLHTHYSSQNVIDL